MFTHGKMLHSRAYNRAVKTNSRTVRDSVNESLFEVEFFAVVDNQAVAICRRLALTEQRLVFPNRVLWDDLSTYLNRIFQRVHASSPYAPCEVLPIGGGRLQGPLVRILDYVCSWLVN